VKGKQEEGRCKKFRKESKYECRNIYRIL